jgi:hypothetical protein
MFDAMDTALATFNFLPKLPLLSIEVEPSCAAATVVESAVATIESANAGAIAGAEFRRHKTAIDAVRIRLVRT